MKLLKKITIGSINSKRGGFEVNPTDQPKVIARIYGISRTVASKETNFGPYLRFGGDFRAINAEGEECASPVLILPSPADGALSSAMEADTLKAGVTFAFDVLISPIPKKTPIDRGYEYIVRPLMNTEASDPMKAIASSLPPLPAMALPGPTPTPAADPAPAPTPEPAPSPAPAAQHKKK